MTCGRCGQNNWVVQKGNHVLLYYGTNTRVNDPVDREDIRCSSCNHKATISEASAIRSSDLYKQTDQTVNGTLENEEDADVSTVS